LSTSISYIYENIGDVYKRLKRYKEAIESYNNGLEEKKKAYED
jgi:hypothetical protein